LKILKAASSRDSKELDVLLHLSNAAIEHPGKGHVLELLDHFKHDGPNGTHLCLVLPAITSDGEAITVREKARQATDVRVVSKQILLGLDFIHGLGIIHGGE
jgi:serine/threonine-protein kinase SRPK3